MIMTSQGRSSSVAMVTVPWEEAEKEKGGRGLGAGGGEVHHRPKGRQEGSVRWLGREEIGGIWRS